MNPGDGVSGSFFKRIIMKDAKRGFVPSDEREFGEKELPKLRKASEEVLYLLDHGYPVKGATRFIDGFNVIIGLEIAFSGSMLFTCMDGTIRDLAGLRGTYRLIPETDLAIKALLRTLERLNAGKGVIYLDKPVSNSGRLKQKIYEYADKSDIEVEVEIEDAVDHILKQKPLIATGDAIILDECDRWFNLVRTVIEDNIGEYTYIDICP